MITILILEVQINGTITHADDALTLIAAERSRQVSDEGWTSEHDDAHGSGEIACAAAALAWPISRDISDGPGKDDLWPTGWAWKPSSRRRELVKAGALIAAEIDRLLRAGRES